MNKSPGILDDRIPDTPEQTARKAHEGQLRRGGEPYINHVERVVSKMTTETEKAVAWLHDVIEDHPSYKANIIHLYGPEIYSPLFAISKKKGERYMDYIVRVSKSQVAIKVKLYDMMDNMMDNPSPASKVDYLRGIPFLLQHYEGDDIDIDLSILTKLDD